MTLDESRHWCRKIARTQAKNFYYSFLLLDQPRRDAMCAIYAFNRIADDLSDGPGPRQQDGFDAFATSLDRALDGRMPEHPLWPALADTVERYRIPREYFHQTIEGVRSDLDFQAPQTFEDLYAYCYRVASVVGLTIIHVLGFRDPRAILLAERCGVAFQLTNILRDVKEDYDRDRIYLPREDLARFQVRDADLGAGTVSPALRNLLAAEAARARGYYDESRPLIGMVDPAGRAMLSALIETYSRLLKKIEARDFEVLRERVSLPRRQKLWILARHAVGV